MDEGVTGKWWRSGQVGMPYLALHQHGNVYEHVVELFDAALQADDVLVPGFDLTQGLFRDARVHDLCWTQSTGTVNTDVQQNHLRLKQSRAQTLHSTYPCSEDCRVAALQHLLQFFVRRRFPSWRNIRVTYRDDWMASTWPDRRVHGCHSLISSCLWIRPLLLSLKSTWASLYLVITSTNFLDRTACWNKTRNKGLFPRKGQNNIKIRPSWVRMVLSINGGHNLPGIYVSSCQPTPSPAPLTPDFFR